MTESLILGKEGIILFLLAVSIILSVFLRRIKFPYTIGLFIFGYILAAFIAPNVELLSSLAGYVPESDLILYIFLPPLIFESAIALNSRLLFRNIVPVLTMAILGVIVSALIIGLILSAFSPIPLLYVLLFGALISATDPVAVISLFKQLGVPKRLLTLVEGESLLNDASAIVSFNLIIGLITFQAASDGISIFSITEFFSYSLISSFFGGIIIGLIFAFGIYFAIESSPDHPHIHQTVSLIIAYAAYIVSDAVFDFSGVIAVVAAGITVNWLSVRSSGNDYRRDLFKFWEYIGFLANSLIFLIVGISITGLESSIILSWDFVLISAVAIASVLIARAVSVFGLYSVTNLIEKDRKVPLSYQTVIFWGGLRGAVCLALVLSVPQDFLYRDMLVGFTVVVVVFTILISGMTIGPLVNRLNLSSPEIISVFEKLWLGVKSDKTRMKVLREKLGSPDNIIPGYIIENKISIHEADLNDKKTEFMKLWDKISDQKYSEEINKLFWLKAIEHEIGEYRDIFRIGIIPPEVYYQLTYDAQMRHDDIQVTGSSLSFKKYYSPVFRAKTGISKVICDFTNNDGNNDQSGRSVIVLDILLKYAVVMASVDTKKWVLNTAAETGADSYIVDSISEEYGRMQISAESGLRRISSESPEVMDKVYSYLSDRFSSNKVKELLFELSGESTFSGKVISCAIADIRSERSETENGFYR